MIEVKAWEILNFYNFFIGFVLFMFAKRDNVSNVSQTKTYGRMLLTILLLIVGDSLSRMFEQEGPLLIIPTIGNYIVYAFDPLMGFFILEYIDTWIQEKTNKFHPARLTVIGFTILNFILVTISTVFDLELFFYYVNGEYRRGVLFIFRALLMAFIFVLVEGYILVKTRNNRTQEAKMIRFFLLPAICLGLLQILTYNIALEYTGVIIYALILYIYVQSRKASVDFLTGLVNRRIFKNELDTKIKGKEKFSGIMIDLDRFKQINDQYGHREGDNALTIVSELINMTFRKSDIVSRYGGDEFCILTDVAERYILDSVICRLRENLKEFNAENKLPYQISLSIGYDVYSEEFKNASDFLNHLDEKMYVEKKKHHRCN